MSNTMGYMLYYSHNPEWYELSKWVSSGDRGTFENLPAGTAYFWIEAYNFDGWANKKSNVVTRP